MQNEGQVSIHDLRRWSRSYGRSDVSQFHESITSIKYASDSFPISLTQISASGMQIICPSSSLTLSFWLHYSCHDYHSSENDRHIWIRDINRVAASVNTSASPAVIDDSSSFSTELLNKIDQAFSEGHTEETKRSFAKAITATNKKANTLAQKHLQVRTNIMAHVFWHRNCSLGRYEYEKAFAVSSWYFR